jgi:putative methionine-R-sulfoxide reductase with GAF domain
MFRRISTFWIILIGLLITSAVSLGLMAFSAIRTTSTGVEREQIVQLTARVDAHASAIDERLRAFENATRLSTAQARVLLLTPEYQLTPEELQTVLQKYQRDANNVYGLDNWYDHSYFPQFGDDHQSNVFLNQNTPLTSKLESAIAVTEQLNPVFEAIHNSNIGTQWIYLTLAEGMMRLYPWQSNDNYPVDWEPQTISFYTVANRERNPEKESVWTAPYNDYAGAGLMVTNSYPIYDGDTLIGVMSHDFCIADLLREVLGFQVGEEGFAFLLDRDGNIIAHKDYAPEGTALGEELSIRLSEEEPTMAPAVAALLSEGEGARNVTDELGNEWVVVFDRIPTTDWHLGLMQPRREIIQPALNITRQLLIGAIGLVGLAFVVSIVLASWISRPIIQLSGAARVIESSVGAMDASVGTDQDLAVGTVDLGHIGGPREVSSLISVFRQMVGALQKRINELGSIYVMGQTITSTIDYEQTLQTVLSAVQRVVRYDAAEVSIVQGNELIVKAWSGQEGFEDTTGHRCPLDQRLKGQIAHSKMSLLIPTVSLVELQEHLPTTDAATLTEIVGSGVKSFLGVPLLIGERLIGMLTLVDREAGIFSEDARRQLSRLAAQASIAIENAIKVRERERALKEQIRELQIEIDEVKKTRQVEEIVESDYFQRLQEQARRLRQRAKRRA